MERLRLVKTTVQSVQVRHSSADKTMILFVVVSKIVIGNTPGGGTRRKIG